MLYFESSAISILVPMLVALHAMLVALHVLMRGFWTGELKPVNSRVCSSLPRIEGKNSFYSNVMRMSEYYN